MTGRLLVISVDSVLLKTDVIGLLAEFAGKRDEVVALADAASRGDLDVADSLRRQVATLEGLPVSAVDFALRAAGLTPGAKNLVETLHGRGWTIGFVSEGFEEIVAPLAARLGVTRYRANTLETVDGVLTGKTPDPIVDRAAKARALAEWAEESGIAMEDTVAVGCDSSDLDLLAQAGLGIAFNAEATVQAKADVAVTNTRVDVLLLTLED